MTNARASSSLTPRQSRSPALWQQLQWVARVVSGVVHQGRSLTPALKDVPMDLRPGVQALSFEVLRQWGTAGFVLQRLVKRAPAPQGQALLQSALALMTLPRPIYDDHTLVNQTIEAAKRAAATRPLAGLINACLRRFLRERDDWLTQAMDDPQARWNHPAWWIERLQVDHSEQWRDVLHANQTAAPLTLRVNARVMDAEQYVKALNECGLEGRSLGEATPQAVVLSKAVPVSLLPGFDEGWVSVQDAGAQRAAPLLLQGFDHIDASLRVLDACAAPGGKTAHLLELSNAQVTALEIDPERTVRISESLDRLKLKANIVTADAADVSVWWDGQAFDAILLDAPCTASGIVRRHPDVRWLRQPQDIEQLVGVQGALLNTLWGVLKPGGRLLYSTCSVFKAEGHTQVQTFLARHTDARLLPSPGHLLPTPKAKPSGLGDNGHGEHDGFYYALLEKDRLPRA